MKRILITGVFGSGKTQLVDMLEKSLCGLGYKAKSISEVARECPLKLNQEQTILSTSWLIMAQMENEIKSRRNLDFIIYDRGLPDIIAHTREIKKETPEEKIFQKKLEELGRFSLTNYDYIFLSKRSDKFDIQLDGLRSDSIEYQVTLEKHHINYLNQTKEKYVALVGDNKDRLPQILEFIN